MKPPQPQEILERFPRRLTDAAAGLLVRPRVGGALTAAPHQLTTDTEKEWTR